MGSYIDYVERSNSLIAAGDQVLRSLQVVQRDKRSMADDLIAAAEPPGVNGFGYLASADGSVVAEAELSSEDVFSGLLLEFQAANLLMSAGFASGEREGVVLSSTLPFIKDAIGQLESTKSSISVALEQGGAFAFAGEPTSSPDLAAACTTFRSSSTDALDTLVKESVLTVNLVFEELKKLDGDKVLDALKNLGDSVKGVAEAGRLINRGIEKIRCAIETLFRIFGKEALDRIKDQISDSWEKFKSGEYTKDVLVWLYHTNETEGHIEQILGRKDLKLQRVDSAVDEVADLLEKHRRTLELIRNMLKAVVLAATILGFLHIAMPWLPLLTATAYVTLLVSAVLVGRAFSASISFVPWIKGVGTIVDDIAAA